MPEIFSCWLTTVNTADLKSAQLPGGTEWLHFKTSVLVLLLKDAFP